MQCYKCNAYNPFTGECNAHVTEKMQTHINGKDGCKYTEKTIHKKAWVAIWKEVNDEADLRAEGGADDDRP